MPKSDWGQKNTLYGPLMHDGDFKALDIQFLGVRDEGPRTPNMESLWILDRGTKTLNI